MELRVIAIVRENILGCIMTSRFLSLSEDVRTRVYWQFLAQLLG